MKFRALLIAPIFLFLISQIISICGAFDVLATLENDGINDMSLEDIVFIDPFLNSHGCAKSVVFLSEPAVCSKPPVSVRFVDEIFAQPICNPSAESIEKGVAIRPCKLWLSHRILRI